MPTSGTPPTATEFTIRPNSACNDGSWRWLFAGLVVLSFTIAIRFALLGFWLILPFTILEVSALAVVLWVVLARSAWLEEVRIDGEVVEIRRRIRGRDRTWRFPQRRIQVAMRDPALRWYPRRLVLGCAGRWVEIGGCLTDDERRSLAAAIRGALRRCRTPGGAGGLPVSTVSLRSPVTATSPVSPSNTGTPISPVSPASSSNTGTPESPVSPASTVSQVATVSPALPASNTASPSSPLPPPPQ